jgi:hypothetical protein
MFFACTSGKRDQKSRLNRFGFQATFGEICIFSAEKTGELRTDLLLRIL